MNYLQHDPNKRKKRKVSKIFSLPLSVAALLLIVSLMFPHWSTEIFHKAGEPLWKTQDLIIQKAGVINIAFSSKKELKNRNEELRTKLKEAQTDLTKAKELQERVNSLKELCGREQKTEEEGVLSAILKRPNMSPYDTLILDVGEDDNIKKGQLIKAENSVIIGEVREVYKSTSKAVLFSSPGEQTEARLKPASIDITMNGQGGGTLKSQVPKATEVNKGDHVILPGIETNIFGTVEGIKQKTTDPYKFLFISNPVNIFESSWVKVLKER